MRYLFLDCEMGGRDIKYSLLTAAFIVTDSSFQILGELDLRVKPDDGDYIVSGQGMCINGIDLRKHDSRARSYKETKPILYEFLKNTGGGRLLTPVGHGVKGDIQHIQKYIISEGSWNSFCTYHYIDTSVILQFLRAKGKMPEDCDGSVEALCKHFQINQDTGNICYHDALFDARMTMEIYKKMLDL